MTSFDTNFITANEARFYTDAKNFQCINDMIVEACERGEDSIKLSKYVDKAVVPFLKKKGYTVETLTEYNLFNGELEFHGFKVQW